MFNKSKKTISPKGKMEETIQFCKLKIIFL